MSTVIPATPDRIWEDLVDISRHVEWMADAVAIRFQTDQHRGVGTSFETDTKVGPFRLTDEMEITEWEPGRVMGIRHTGAVTGIGRFTLEAVPGAAAAGGPGADGDRRRADQTRFTWEETLTFPAWMGGWLGSQAGRPVLKRIWQRNLDNLRRRFE